MPIDIDDEQLTILQSFPRERQGRVGWMPASWADIVLDEWEGFDPPLPLTRFNRAELRAYCRLKETPPMHAFIAVMAWGEQMPQRRDYPSEIRANRRVIEDLLEEIRAGTSRRDGYEKLRGRVKHLGPSYMTKILTFLSPNDDMAIMDQWAVKSINLLYGREIIRLARNQNGSASTSPLSTNTGVDYDRYCGYLDDLQARLGEATLSDTEERIFSRLVPGQRTWRKHVMDTWRPPQAAG